MKKLLLFLMLLVSITLTSGVFPSQSFAQDTTSIESAEGLEFTDISDAPAVSTDTATPASTVSAADTTTSKAEVAASTTTAKSPTSLLGIFVAGFLGGILALLMPCIFPMLPLTVSFFTKKSNSKAQAVRQALLYGISIIVIYVALGLVVTSVFGSDALNSLSTNGIFNFLFFLMLVVFGASFLGAFEITLPSSFVNKIDEKSDKGGLIGIFFMAFSLALVSFSCTGPIVGTLLVDAATKGELWGPAIGMFGFSLALAIPFTLFALFPSMLKSLPKSGGWLNSVKVVLGFIELAFSLKFLSNVDLAYHWNLFDREVFLALWIVIFALLGMYLIGKIKFSHDSDLPFLSVPRTFLSIIVFAFVVYLIPGMWGAPLKSVSAFLPPMATQDFNLADGRGASTSVADGNGPSSVLEKVKYKELFHARLTPHHLDAVYDFDQALEASKKLNKPILIDFTGWNCVNCRKMEQDVWSDPEVLSVIRNEYILAELVVDDKTALPENEQYVSTFSGNKVKTVGNKWSDFQASKFNTNSQPFYVLVDSDGKALLAPSGANYEVKSYLAFLKEGLEKFKNK